ncbi:MAG TPA: aminopeptidase [Trueperaceae bacterium]|nr:aminopeptidase [Trueperaceae bacterium]
MNDSQHATRLERYADLLLRVGVNLQPGQKLMFRTTTEAVELTRLVVAKAYQMGSPYVEVFWSDEGVTRARFLHAPEGSFTNVPEHVAARMVQLAEEGAASLAVSADDPDNLAGTDPKRMATYLEHWRPLMKPYYELSMSDRVAWSGAAAASPAWARRVFPGLPEDEALARLWDAIFHAVRVDAADPVAAWREHTAALLARKERLNERRYAALRFRGPGTDLRVGLADGHQWDGGASYTPGGVEFVANMPTEEVFTAPHRERVDGVVRATKPLAYAGTLIDGIEVTFANGVVTKAVAREGQEALEHVLNTDPGARRLGEVALVPASSPIARTGLLFYETLFDENAACHLALGQGYAMTLQGGQRMSAEERRAAGLNESLTHVDFMIGSDQVDVDGELPSGELEPVMRAGEWVG